MKRFIALFLLFALLLTGCGSTTKSNQISADPSLISADALLERLLAAVPEGDEDPETVVSDELSAYLAIYGIDMALVKNCAIARLGGSRVFELAVIDLTVRSTAAEDALLSYLLRRQGDFTGYAPDQAAIAEQGRLFAVDGDFRLILSITEDVDAVTDTLETAGYTRITQVESARVWEDELPPSADPDPVTTTTEPVPELSSDPSSQPTEEPEPSEVPSPTPSPEPSEEPAPAPSEEPSPEPSFTLPSGWKKYTPPSTDDMTIYDTSAILAAWESGSSDELLRKDKELYQRCVELIDQLITDDMTDYEKEWAIYSWLVNHVTYDWRQNDPKQTAPRTSFQPYGAIVQETAVCLGYASAFQLFMDMLDVECITVIGAAFSSSGDHAWNMVRLDGEWYCVDATWDLGKGSSPNRCSYFNVTSDHMAKTDHQWDYANTPMATATDKGK